MRRELLDRFGALPAPVERLLEVSQLRYRAEQARLVSVGLEEGQLVLRFGDDWSRADTMRATGAAARRRTRCGRWRAACATAPTSCACRPPRDPPHAWQLTRPLVERLAGATREGARGLLTRGDAHPTGQMLRALHARTVSAAG